VQYEDAAMAGMSAGEVATLKDLLKRVHLNLEKIDRAQGEQPAAGRRSARTAKVTKKRVKRSVKS
jgi:hypothetical protein